MDPKPSNRVWRKPSDTDMTPYKNLILDRWAAGLTGPEIAAEIPQLTRLQIANFLRYEGMKRDEARDPRIDPVAHHSAKMARRKPEPVAHGPLLCPELGIEIVTHTRVNRYVPAWSISPDAFITISLPRVRFLEDRP